MASQKNEWTVIRESFNERASLNIESNEQLQSKFHAFKKFNWQLLSGSSQLDWLGPKP